MRKKLNVKNSFFQSAFINTLSKVLGIIYVIPFYYVIREQGGALYGYIYTIYLFFAAIATFGLPLAVRKICSEYHSKGYYKTEKKAFIMSRRIAFCMGFLMLLLLFVLAPFLSKLIVGNLRGIKYQEQITFVIRLISVALLVTPVLNVYRSYLEGHKLVKEKYFSDTIESIIKFSIIIIGSFISVKLFHFSLKTTMGVCVFGIVAGIIGSYFYILGIIKKKKENFDNNGIKVKEPNFSNKVIIRKVINYALPFIMIDLFKVIYDFVDLLTVVKTVSHMSAYSVAEAESIIGILLLWGSNFSMIIVSISTGIIVTMIPKLIDSFTTKNMEYTNNRVNQILQLLILFVVPITVVMSILSKPIWMVFYGNSRFGSSIFSYYIFIGLFMSIYLVITSILYVLKDYKTVFISFIVGFVLKLLLNISLMNSFNKMGLPPYYGSISATIIGYFVGIIICLYVLYKKYNITYESTLKEIINIFLATILMILSIFLFRLILPYYTNSRILNVLLLIVYVTVGFVVYFITVYKTKTVNNILKKSINIKDSI
ncbi:MAG: oligosaccharide flippase family protein [Bacilli bacterium]|nr:oligosaccharide flippase family protein [Bacilli bacterium]